MFEVICSQPHCALQERGVGPTHVAELALRALTGGADSHADSHAEFEPIRARDACRLCIDRVLAAHPPLPTPRARQRAEEAGHSSWRRRRRREERAARLAGC